MINTFASIIEELRFRCPVDRSRTLDELGRHLFDECQEVRGAVARRNNEDIIDELGDVLTCVFMIISLGNFSHKDVVHGACQKMVRRHPHVFGKVPCGCRAEANRIWREVKEKEAKLGYKTDDLVEGHINRVSRRNKNYFKV